VQQSLLPLSLARSSPLGIGAEWRRVFAPPSPSVVRRWTGPPRSAP